MTREEFEIVIAVNQVGTYLGMKAVVDSMRAAGGLLRTAVGSQAIFLIFYEVESMSAVVLIQCDASESRDRFNTVVIANAKAAESQDLNRVMAYLICRKDKRYLIN